MGFIDISADIKSAYLTTTFNPFEYHYVRLPRILEDAVLAIMGWCRPKGYGRLVFRLLGGLYGHIIAGDMFSGDLGDLMTGVGGGVGDWLEEGHGEITLFYHLDDNDNLDGLASYYVDDLTASGTPKVIADLKALLSSKYQFKNWIEGGNAKMLGCNFSKHSLSKDDIVLVQSMHEYWELVSDKIYVFANDANLKNRNRPIDTPCCDEPADLSTESEGRLKDHAASVVGALSYGAYMNDTDLAFPTVALARHTTRWRGWEDKMVLRLANFLQQFKVTNPTRINYPLVTCQRISTLDMNDLELHIHVDADHGGHLSSRKSTSGFVIYVIGLHGTKIVLESKSKTQSIVALSTCESEIEAIKMVAKIVFSNLEKYRLVFGPIKIFFHSDASAAIGAIKKGFSKSLGYSRRKGEQINIAWLSERLSETLEKISTIANASDVLTKALDRQSYWRHITAGLLQFPWPTDEEEASRMKRCACTVCINVTGHSATQSARCTNLTKSEFCEKCVSYIGHNTCECPCWGYCMENHNFLDFIPKESRMKRIRQMRERRELRNGRRKRRGALMFGRKYSSDEDGDGPERADEYRAPERADEYRVWPPMPNRPPPGVGWPQPAPFMDVERPRKRPRGAVVNEATTDITFLGMRRAASIFYKLIMRSVNRSFTRRYMNFWKTAVDNIRTIRDIYTLPFVEMPVEDMDTLAAVLRLAHTHGITYARMSRALGCSAATLSYALRDNRLPVRTGNLMLQTVNREYIENMANDEDDDDMSEESLFGEEDYAA